MVENWDQYEDLEYYPDRVCGCGCSGMIRVRSSHKYDGIPIFINGHNRRESFQTEEVRERIGKKNSENMKQLWQDLEYQKMQSVSHSRKRNLRVKRTQKICEYCGVEFEVCPWEGYRKFCSQTCYGKYASEYRVGSNAANWKGGLSARKILGDDLYSSDFDERLKRLVRERDNYSCKLCEIIEEESKKTFGRGLSVHHINYNKYDASPWNLVSLCCRCHAKVNYNREYWMELITSLVRSEMGKCKLIDLDYMLVRKSRVW